MSETVSVYGGATAEEIAESLLAIFGGEVIFTYFSSVASFKSNHKLGFVFHTKDPSPDMEATDLGVPGTIAMVSTFLAMRLADYTPEDSPNPPDTAWVKTWAITPLDTDFPTSVRIVVAYGIRQPSTTIH